MDEFPLTGFAMLAGVAAVVVCCFWAVGEFVASYRKLTAGTGMSCLPPLPALIPLLAPLLYVRSFAGTDVPWPGWKDLVLALLIIAISIPASFVIGSLLPRLFAQRAADSEPECRRFWILRFCALVLLTLGICSMAIVQLSASTPTISNPQ